MRQLMQYLKKQIREMKLHENKRKSNNNRKGCLNITLAIEREQALEQNSGIKMKQNIGTKHIGTKLHEAKGRQNHQVQRKK